MAATTYPAIRPANNSRLFWSLLAIIAFFIAHALGYTASAEEISYGSAILVGVGDIELKDINDLLKQQGQIFEEFKKTNDERLKAIESKGYAPADLTEKVDRMNEAMSKLDKEILEIQKKANRLNPGDGGLTEEQEEHKKAFNLYLRKGIDNGLAEIQRKAMNTGSDPDGGYLVLPEIDQMIDRVVPTVSAMYRLANVVTIGTNKYQKRVKKTGMAMRRTADGSGGGETTEPTYANIDIEAFTAEVEPWVNNETLEDAFIDLANDLADEAAIAFAEGAGAEFITGNGVGKARGITSYDKVANASYAWGKVGYIASGKSAAFASVAPADKIVALQHALKSAYRPGAVWLTNDATLGTIRQLKDGSGSYYIWQPDPAAAFGGRLLGNPVEVDDNLADIAAASYSLAFGNFKRGYTIVNRAGTTLIRDNITTKGVTKFNFRRRFGGGITNFEAIKLMKFATS
jgi:HK97 family phage major capsid protein